MKRVPAALATGIVAGLVLLAPGPAWAQSGPPTSDLRVIAASLSLDGASVVVDGAPVAGALAYGTATPVVPLGPGPHVVQVGDIAATVEVLPGCTTNVVAAERPFGTAPTLVAVAGCGTGRIPAGAARVTVLVASDEPGAVEVSVPGASPVNVAPYAVSAPLHPPAGAPEMTLRSAATGAVYSTTELEAAEGTATLAVFTGGGDEPFRLFAVFDGIQPTAPPAGIEINTGPRLSPRAGVLAAAALALVAGLLIKRARGRSLAALLALAAACSGVPSAPRDAGTPRPGPAAPVDASETTTSPAVQPVGVEPPAPATEPLRVRIPALGVDAAVVTLGSESAAALPDLLAGADVAWLRGTATPGSVGIAVLAGHTGRSGVFGRLDALPDRGEVYVADATGSEQRFLVGERAVYAKGTIPDEVWGPVRAPTLALITCTGPVRADGLHRDNLVLWATIFADGSVIDSPS
jgi:sortase (surface protein transpeptidase)